MAYCKYLEELEIPRKDYDYETYTSEKDPRNEKYMKEKEEYGFDSRATWSFDYTLAVYLYSRLRMYKDKAGEIINLEYHKFEFEGKTYTQLEAIDFILEKLKVYLKDEADHQYKNEAKNFEGYQTALRLLSEIVGALWW